MGDLHKIKNHCYHHVAERLQAMHKEVGITLADLTPHVRENIELLAEATVLLETKDSSSNRFMQVRALALAPVAAVLNNIENV